MLEVRDLGRVRYGDALAIQQEFVEKRKRGLVPDQLLFVEHAHVITQGRNGRAENLLASEEALCRAGIEFFPTNRGGDITYHGPGQIVGYPILDLREWKRDVVAYVRTVEQAIMDTLAEFHIAAGRVPGCTGVWVEGRKVAAIGVHISRWVTSHGFALNHTTDLRYFQYIVPCGLTKPVTSMRELGSDLSREQVLAALSAHFARAFGKSIAGCGIQLSRDREEAEVSYTET
jgi:lipoyl(octanoyl) transferase